MNRQLNITRVFAVAFIVSASMQIEAGVPSHDRFATPVQQQKSAPKTPKIYACPMHPEIKSNRKGKCPKCKMTLQPVSETITAGDKEKPAPSIAGGEIVSAEVKPAAGVGDDSSRTRPPTIPDVAVLDQDGRALHFYSDLVKGKTVAINFIFTSCTTICPPLAATFARVQKEIRAKPGKDVQFISISVDPVTDTPERLKTWSAKFKAGAGWTFVTGSKPEIDNLLNAFATSVSRREDHSPTVIVGNDLKGVWTRTYGLARVSQLVTLIGNVSEGQIDESQAVNESTAP